MDRDDNVCKTRIHLLTNAYRKNLCKKKNFTGTKKKQPCFGDIHKFLTDEPTTFLKHLPSSSGLQNENLKCMQKKTTEKWI